MATYLQNQLTEQMHFQKTVKNRKNVLRFFQKPSSTNLGTVKIPKPIHLKIQKQRYCRKPRSSFLVNKQNNNSIKMTII